MSESNSMFLVMALLGIGILFLIGCLVYGSREDAKRRIVFLEREARDCDDFFEKDTVNARLWSRRAADYLEDAAKLRRKWRL